MKVNASETYVSTTVAIVADGDEIAVLCSGNGGNTIGYLSLAGLEERLLHGLGAETGILGLRGGLRVILCKCACGNTGKDEGKKSLFHITVLDFCFLVADKASFEADFMVADGLHDVGGSLFVEELVLHVVHKGRYMGEESTITLAEVVPPVFALWSAAETISGAFSVAGEMPGALLAACRQCVLLGIAEIELALTVHHLKE